MDIYASRTGSKMIGRRPDMRIPIFTPVFFCMALMGVMPLALTTASAQTVSGGKAAGASTAKAAAKKSRTPWGDPDLQGSWSNATTTPLERPAKYAGREFLTAEERAAQDKQTAIGRDKRAAPGTPEDVAGAYNAFWWGWGQAGGRTSLIYDPPNGPRPCLTPEGQKRSTERNETVRTDGPYYGPEDLDFYTRCILRSPLPRLSSDYDNK